MAGNTNPNQSFGNVNFVADFSSLTARALAYVQANAGIVPPYVLNNTGAAVVPFAIKGFAGQTANLLEIKNSADTVLAGINSSGHFVSGSDSLGGGGLILNSALVYNYFNGKNIGSSFSGFTRTNSDGGGQIIENILKPVTSGANSDLFEITLPTLKGCGGIIEAALFAANATDVQNRTQLLRFEAVNKGGVYTSSIGIVSESIAASIGTLTGVWSIVTGANKITIRLVLTTSLGAPTAVQARFSVKNLSDQTITLL